MSVFVPETILERWVHAALSGSADVRTALGNTQIYPRMSPSSVTGRHITHGYISPDGGYVANPMGQPVAQVGVIWQITGWEPSLSTQVLEPVMEAVQAAITSATGKPATRRFSEATRSWSVSSRWAGPGYVPTEVVPAGTWSAVRHLFRLDVSPA